MKLFRTAVTRLRGALHRHKENNYTPGLFERSGFFVGILHNGQSAAHIFVYYPDLLFRTPDGNMCSPKNQKEAHTHDNPF